MRMFNADVQCCCVNNADVFNEVVYAVDVVLVAEIVEKRSGISRNLLFDAQNFLIYRLIYD